MKNEKARKEDVTYPLDASAGLYHEAQADGVPYEEEPGPFAGNAPIEPRP